ncbi:MAG: MATE family efflux transporter [Chloroflexi bacterium]|nr:MATE family efflux transporter [Chloroflexota bacterium]
MARGRRSSEYATRDLTSGSIPNNLWFLGWPQIVAGAASAIDEVSDTFWAGFLGPTAMASVGVGGAFINFLNTFRTGLDTSARAMVSRAVGAGDMEQANHVAYQSLLINTGVTVVIMSLGILGADLLWQALGVADALSAEGLAYQRMRFAASILFGANLVSGSLLTSGGDSFTPMRAQLVGRIVHIALTPPLLFGFGPIPAMGIAGGALAYGLGHGIGAYINFRALLAGSSRLHLKFEGLKIDGRLALRQLQIGVPSAVTGAQASFSGLVVIGFIAPFGAPALAVYSVTQRLQQLTSFGGQSLAQASGVIVGQNLGARKPDRAKATVWWALACVGSLQAAICLLVFLIPEAFIFAFTRDAQVIELGAVWLRVAVLGIMFFGVSNVLVSTINTAGDTMIPMLTGLVSLWLVQQPLAILLSGAVHWQVLGLQVAYSGPWAIGVLGVPVAIAVAATVRFLLVFVYFLRGRWMNKEVLVRPASSESTPAIAATPR